MPYQPVTDVPDIETKGISIKKLDSVMYETLERTRLALRHRYNFKRRVREESELISILRSQLLLYKSTHQSLRIILAKAYRSKTYSLVPDAASLVREQIEKIYVISLFLNDTSKWLLHYSRSAWRTDYETYLLEREEYGTIERHREFLTKHYPEYLAKTQRVRVGRKSETIVSDFAKRALTHRWTHPGDERPTWFVNAQKNNKRKFALRVLLSEFPSHSDLGIIVLLRAFQAFGREHAAITQFAALPVAEA